MGKNALFRCAFFGQDAKIVKLLQEPGVTVSNVNEEGETALHCACSSDNPSTVQLLLENGAPPNARNCHGETALHYASVNNLYESVVTLVDAGADINVRTLNGRKAVDLARSDEVRSYLEDLEVGLMGKYSELFTIISMSDFRLAGVLCQVANTNEVPRKEKDILAKKFVKIFDSKNLCLDFIREIINAEVQATLHEHTLFRQDSMATKVMTAYAKLVGLQYLEKAIGPLVRKALSNPRGFELESSRLQAGETVDQNFKNLKRVCQEFLDAIFDSLDDCPFEIREICVTLRNVVGDKFPTSSHQAVSGFLFLRFFSAAISNPNGYGLIEGDPPSMERRRPLVLIAKTLQNLANDVEFGAKEPYMKVMNAFILENQQPLRKFYANNFSESIEMEEGRDPVFGAEDITSADMVFLHSIMWKLMDKLGTRLDAAEHEVDKAKSMMKEKYKLKKPSESSRTDASEAASRRAEKLSSSFEDTLKVLQRLGAPPPEEWAYYF